VSVACLARKMRPDTPRARFVALSCVALSWSMASCDLSASDPLPDDYLAAVTRTFEVSWSDLVTDSNGNPVPVRALSAVEASGKVQGTDTPLVLAQRMGAKALALPRGLGCDLTLARVFPDPSNDPADARAYAWESLRDHLRETAARGMVPIWQTLYDIGEDSCAEDPEGIAVAAHRIGDSQTWSAVVGLLARWVNGALNPYYSDEAKARLQARGLDPAYAEFLPDAMRLGGYQNAGVAGVIGLYRPWFRAIHDAFLEDTSPRILARIAPSLPLTSEAEASDSSAPIGAFLGLLETDATIAPEVLGLLSRSRSPEDHRRMLLAVRAALDRMDLRTVRLADMGMALAPDLWEGLAPLHPTRAQRSALFAAYGAMVRMLEQDLLTLLVPERWSGPLASPSATIGEDLFQDEDGRTLPAYAALQVFARLDQADAVRLQAINVSESADGGTTPSDSLRVLAARTSNGGVNLVIVALPPLENPRPAIRMRYDITVKGLADAPKGWVITRWVVDSTAVGLKGPVEQSPFAPEGGTVRVVREILGPAIHQVDLSPKSQ